MNLQKAKTVLGIQDFTGIDGLKKRFYELAHQYHPDKNPDVDASLFRELIAAYQFAVEHVSELYQEFHVQEEPNLEQKKIVIENDGDIFEDIFGFSRSGRVLGYHEPQAVYLTIPELFNGIKKKERLIAYQRCELCHGSGAQAGTMAKVCTHCFGQGFIRKKDGGRVCPKCGGRGRSVSLMCTSCNGFGRIRKFHMQEFTLPPGLTPFEVYTIEGYDLQLQKKTNIFLEPRVLHDPIFKIDKCDLLCEYHIDFEALDADQTFRVTTPIGAARLRIPKTAKNGDVMMIKGAGLYRDSTQKKRGDLCVTLRSKNKSLKTRFVNFLKGIFE